MDVSRREFLRLSGGAAAFAVTAGLGLLHPRRAYAVLGIDDAVLGGAVLLIATLGGYALSRTVANNTLGAMGYGFSDFVSDSSHQAEAVTRAIADANNLGVEIERQNAEDAARSIAEGTGYFAEVMAGAAQTGRVALDNFISGADALPAVLRSLVAGFVGSVMSPYPVGYPGVSAVGASSAYLPYPFRVASLAEITAFLVGLGFDVSNMVSTDTEGFLAIRSSHSWNGASGMLITSSVDLNVSVSGTALSFTPVGGNLHYSRLIMNSTGTYVERPTTATSGVTYSVPNTQELYLSGGLVVGSVLPGVDRAIDAPDVISPAYDSLPLGHDLVIDPSTDEVTSAGTIALPQSIPEVSGDVVGTYADILNGTLSGVVPGVVSLPVPVSTPVSVGTTAGVSTMPISEAISTETSIAQSGEIVTPPPVSPITPPVSVPDGPWLPAVSLPFEQVWPFNMIYSMVGLFNTLGS